MFGRCVVLAALLAAFILSPITDALAGGPEAAAPPKERTQMLGDWGGTRTSLAAHGIIVDLRLTQYEQWVASGGVNQNDEYGGTMDYRINADLKKLFGLWGGLSVNMHARTRWGDDVNADAGALVLPNTALMMPAPGNYKGTNVTGLTVTQMFPLYEGHLGSVTVGMLDAIDLVTGFFPHIGYGQEGFSNVNALVSAMPWFGSVQGLSLYGGMAVSINEKYKSPESGVLFAGTANNSTSWGSLSKNFDDGVFLAGFHRFFWDLDDKMGYFMVFAGGSTKDQASNDPHDFVVIPGQGIKSTERKKPWDVALYVYQDIWQAQANPNRKVSVFVGGTVGPDNPQFSNWNIFGTLEAFGLRASRPHDRMGVAAWYNGLSPNFKILVSPVASLRDTSGAEIYYNFAITPWAHLTADLQFVQNQNKGNDIAVIPGGRLVVDF